jgi:DNA-binding transcriptional ArsR family regulator
MTADLVHRGRTDGADTALAELHPAVSWNSRGLTIEHSGAQGSHGMEGNELLLMPSAFTTADPWPISVPPHPPLLTYPARGTEALWSGAEPIAIDELAGVLGTSRARLLAELRTPTSTSDLAARISITTSGASQHLTALRAAGLVSSHRTGRSVLHARTATAEAMIANAAATDEDPPSA